MTDENLEELDEYRLFQYQRKLGVFSEIMMKYTVRAGTLVFYDEEITDDPLVIIHDLIKARVAYLVEMNIDDEEVDFEAEHIWKHPGQRRSFVQLALSDIVTMSDQGSVKRSLESCIRKFQINCTSYEMAIGVWNKTLAFLDLMDFDENTNRMTY